MRVVELEAFPVDEIKGEQLPYTQLEDERVRTAVKLLLAQPPAVITSPEVYDECLPFGDTFSADAIGEAGYRMYQPTEAHKRSFVIEHPGLPAELTDEFGNTYRHYTIKGNNFSNKAVMETLTAANGFIAYGLQEATSIRRILRASAHIRSLGIPTEYILGVSEPTSLPSPVIGSCVDYHKWEDRQEYKRELIISEFQSRAHHEQTFELLEKLNHALGRTAFYITLRAMDSPYRYAELLAQGSRLFEKLEETAPDDIQNFMYREVPKRIGANMARWHAADVVHGFPVVGNVTIHGTPIDLDSVRGEPLGLGDEDINNDDVAKDLARFVESLLDLYAGNTQITNQVTWNFIHAYLDEFTKLSGDNALDTLLYVTSSLHAFAADGFRDQDDGPNAQQAYIDCSVIIDIYLLHNKLGLSIKDITDSGVPEQWAASAKTRLDDYIENEISKNLEAMTDNMVTDVFNDGLKRPSIEELVEHIRSSKIPQDTGSELWRAVYRAVGASIGSFVAERSENSGLQEDDDTKELIIQLLQRVATENMNYEKYVKLELERWMSVNKDRLMQQIIESIKPIEPPDSLAEFAVALHPGEKNNTIFAFEKVPHELLLQLISDGILPLRVISIPSGPHQRTWHELNSDSTLLGYFEYGPEDYDMYEYSTASVSDSHEQEEIRESLTYTNPSIGIKMILEKDTKGALTLTALVDNNHNAASLEKNPAALLKACKPKEMSEQPTLFDARDYFDFNAAKAKFDIL